MEEDEEDYTLHPMSRAPGGRIPARWSGQLSITVTLATAISLLGFVSVGGVLGVGLWLANKNTLALMNANANQSFHRNNLI